MIKRVALFFIKWSLSIASIVDGLFSFFTLGLVTGKYHPSLALRQAMFLVRMRYKWGLSKHQKKDKGD